MTTTTTRANRTQPPTAVADLLRTLADLEHKAFSDGADHRPSPLEEHWPALRPAAEAVEDARAALTAAERDLGTAGSAVRKSAADAAAADEPARIADHLAAARLALNLAEGAAVVVERRAREHRAAVRRYDSVEMDDGAGGRRSVALIDAANLPPAD